MDQPGRSAADAVAREVGPRHSIEIRVVETIAHDRPPRGMIRQDFDRIEHWYLEDSLHHKFYDRQYFRDDHLVARSSDYRDGSRFARLDYNPDDPARQELITIKRWFGSEQRSGFFDQPYPLRSFSVGRTPLETALRGEATHLGVEDHLGRLCDRFLFRDVRVYGPQDHIYTVDRETGVPLKIAAYEAGIGPETSQVLWEWTSESFDEVDGNHIPLTSKLVSPVAGEGHEATIQTNTYRVTRVEFNKSHQASMFWPVPQPGVGISDTIKGKTSKVAPEPGASVGLVTSSPLSADPIRATPPTDLTAIISSALLAAGLVTIGIGIVLWRRRG